MRSKRYHFNGGDDDANNATVKLASILFDQYSLHGTRDDLSANDIMTIIAACLRHSAAELTASRRTFNDPLLAEAIRVLVPVIHDSPSRPLIDFLTLLSQKKEALPNTSQLNIYSPLSQLSSSILSTLSTTITPTSNNNHMKDITLALKAMARLDWYSTRCITSMVDALMTTRLTSSSMEYVGDLMQSLRVLRVHDTPLLQRVVTWYKWMLRQSYGDTTTTTTNSSSSSRARPYPPEIRAHLAAFALPIAELGYTSSSLIDIVEGALLLQEEGNSHPSDPKLLISFLYILSRQGQEAFTRASFIQGVKRLASTPEEALQSLSAADWIKAFQVHLAPAIEGPPHIKRELVHDADIKKFIEDNASFSWYSAQEKSRTQFLHSDTYHALRHTIEDDLGWPLYTANQSGEVYHTEFISDNTTSSPSIGSSVPSSDRRTAIVCIKPSDELRYYRASIGGSVVSDSGGPGGEMGEYKSTRVMIGSSLVKVRHLISLGWKVVPVWLSEWSDMKSDKDRAEYLIQQSTRGYALGPTPDDDGAHDEY
ncbi:hypothetical protein FOZ62_004102 [Perkinsus olseni]|uniref:RAP domain-containing protein n=1 Tax=Perkinsus olseni TaxID=32597 RepID=A0A7J6PTL4_PEROL|nr:hypothetical protein FOZ62_004102 [Perkinsus olseni]